MVEIVHEFYEALIPPNPRGFAERYIRKKFEKNGCIVWRGGYLHHTAKKDLYIRLKKKYEYALALLDQHNYAVYTIQQLSRAHKGMPDFLVYEHQRFYFIECKLEYEQLSQRQKICIEELHALGLRTKVITVVRHAKMRHVIKNTHNQQKKLLEQQHRIKKHY